MTRRPEEIQADIDAEKAKGTHHMAAALRVLREELKAATATVSAEVDAPAGVVVSVTPEPVVTLGAECSVEVPATPAVDTAEVDFIEKAIANTEIDFSSGQLTGVVKKLYNILWAKLTLWRISRDIVKQIGPGGEWPQWAALGRNDSTGRKEEEKPATVVPARPVACPAPAVTEGGMPIRSARPTAADILASVTGGDPRSGLKQEIGSRPEPVRTPVAAGV